MYKKNYGISQWVSENIYYVMDKLEKMNRGEKVEWAINQPYVTYKTKKGVYQDYSELTMELLIAVGIQQV